MGMQREISTFSFAFALAVEGKRCVVILVRPERMAVQRPLWLSQLWKARRNEVRVGG